MASGAWSSSGGGDSSGTPTPTPSPAHSIVSGMGGLKEEVVLSSDGEAGHIIDLLKEGKWTAALGTSRRFRFETNFDLNATILCFFILQNISAGKWRRLRPVRGRHHHNFARILQTFGQGQTRCVFFVDQCRLFFIVIYFQTCTSSLGLRERAARRFPSCSRPCSRCWLCWAPWNQRRPGAPPLPEPKSTLCFNALIVRKAEN